MTDLFSQFRFISLARLPSESEYKELKQIYPQLTPDMQINGVQLLATSCTDRSGRQPWEHRVRQHLYMQRKDRVKDRLAREGRTKQPR